MKLLILLLLAIIDAFEINAKGKCTAPLSNTISRNEMENHHDDADGVAPGNHRTQSNLMPMENTQYHWATQSVEMQMDKHHEIADGAVHDIRRTHP